MKIPPIKILIIDTIPERQKVLFGILSRENYQVKFVNTADQGMQLTLRNNFDLIICQNELPNYSGFRVFKKLTDYLLKNGVSFFLLLNTIENEDFLIGLEMGIDNFILSPISSVSLLKKVENQFNKRRKTNLLELNKFKEFFENSPVAMFIAENKKIIEINRSFGNHFKIDIDSDKEIMFHDLFEFNGNRKHRINFRKFENGLMGSYYFEQVSLVSNPAIKFNISIHNICESEYGKTFAEIIPVEENKQINTELDYSCPRNGTCLKILDVLSEKLDNSVQLTKREDEVFKLSAKGLPIKQIAGKLNLSERTVEKHRSNIMQKTDSHNIIEAIWVIQRGRNLTEPNMS